MYMNSLFSTLFLSASVGQAVVLPPPPGPWNVSRVTGQLVDTARLDPFASTPTPRALMVSLFQPAECDSPEPIEYMPNLTATYLTTALGADGWPSNSSFTQLEQLVCPPNNCRIQEHSPLVLFSPGLSASRLLYNALAAAVSSFGYTVVTIDHPYDTTIIEYPNGHAVYESATILHRANDTSNATVTQDVGVRAQDCSFVLDQFANATAVSDLMPSRGPDAYDVSRSLIFGHSLGGATATQAVFTDNRFAGGINLDGTLFGNSPSTGFAQPFMFFANSNHTTNDPTWQEIWPLLQGFKLEIELAGSGHLTFMDVALVLATFGEASLAASVPYLGPFPGARAIEIISTYATSFFAMALSGQQSALLEDPDTKFPEVVFVPQP